MIDKGQAAAGGRKQPGRPATAGSALLPLTLILLGAAAFGAMSLNADIIWLDEMFSLGNMGAFHTPYGPAQVVDSLAENSPDHAPLYFILGAQWSRLVGWTQLPARTFSYLAGLLLVAMVYRFAADIAGRRAGVYAALMLSTSGFILLYFHEIRMYTLLMLLAVWHTALYFRLLARRGVGRRTWLLFTFTASALIYTHVHAVFLFFGLIMQHLIFRRQTRRWAGVLLAWGVAMATFVPYLPIFLKGFVGVTTSSNTLSMAYTTRELLGAVLFPLVNDMLVLWFAIVVLAGLALRRGCGRNLRRLMTAVALVFLCIIALNAVFPVISVNRIRYFLIGMPLFVVVLAALLRGAQSRRSIILVFLLVWIAGGLKIHLQAERWAYAGHQTLLMDHPPLHRFADELMHRVRPHDFMLGFAGSPAINWRLKHGYSKGDYYTQVALDIDGAFVNARLRGEELLRDIDERIDDNPYLLLTYDPGARSVVFDDVLRRIKSNYVACDVLVAQADVFVQRYVLRQLDCDRAYQPIHYDNGVRIVDKFGIYDEATDIVHVVTGWQVADEAQLEQYNVSLQILTPDWRNVAQYPDRHLYNDVLKWYAVEMSTEHLPPGDYRVVVILYDRYLSDKVEGVDLTTGDVGSTLPILHFTVEA